MDTSTIFYWVILPLLIFFARILDCSIGTLRIMFIAKSKKLLVPLLGFVEILIWLVAIRQIVLNLTNVIYYIAYAGGFATGNFVGILIEEKLAMGNLIFRIITQNDDDAFIDSLKASGFGLTMIDAEGSRGKVKIIFTMIRRKDKQKVLELINKINPQTFYTIDDVKIASEEAFPLKQTHHKLNYNRWLFLRRRKGK